MIPKDFITEWREHAPWVTDAQVEQDLVVSRALVEIFDVCRARAAAPLPWRHRAVQAPRTSRRALLRGHRSRPDVTRRFEVRSRWWSGSADITTFSLEELLGTKLRALYQRKKGRDLFDLWYAIEKGADPAGIVACFTRYMRESAVDVSRAEFEQNLAAKLEDQIFVADMTPLLREGIAWDVAQAGQVVMSQLLARLSGAPWKRPPREH